MNDLTGLIAYVKRTEDIEWVQQQLKSWGDFSLPTVVVQGDVCRQELLVEIEGLWIESC